jgi:hypothetical protein
VKTFDRHAVPDASGRLDLERTIEANEALTHDPNFDHARAAQMMEPVGDFTFLFHPINTLQVGVYTVCSLFSRRPQSDAARVRAVWSGTDERG